MSTEIESTPMVEQMLESLSFEQRAATAYEKASYVTADKCYNMSPTGGWTCTMAKGHVGNHTGHVDAGDKVCATWTNSTASPSSPSLAVLQAELDEMTARMNQAIDSQRKITADFNIVGAELMQEAINRGWCSDYDNFINRVNELLGVMELPCRNNEYIVTRTFTVTVTKTVEAPDDDEALSNSEFHSGFRIDYPEGWSITEWEEDCDEACAELN